MTDEEVIEYIQSNTNKNIQWKKLPIDIVLFLQNKYVDSDSIQESYFRILNNIDIRPVCKFCGRKVKFDISHKKYDEYCSHKCSYNSKDVVEKRKSTMIERYGYACTWDNPDILKKSVELAHSPENIEKQVATSFERYGKDNYKNRSKAKETLINKSNEEKKAILEKRKKTNLDKYGDTNYNNLEKFRNTCIEKYGVDHPAKSHIVKEKTKNTCMQRYGVEYVFQDETTKKKIAKTLYQKYGGRCNWEKYKSTCLKLYGVENGGGSLEAINKIKETNFKRYGVSSSFERDDVQEKIAKTMLERYGCISPFGSKQVKEKISKIMLEKYGVEHYMQLSNFSEIVYNSMKKHNTLGKQISKEENIVYEILKTKFPNTLQTYYSKAYPFKCDFYIPEINTYIEYQGSQYHHNHPFDKDSEEDLKELNILEVKANLSERHKIGKKSQYDSIIYTWTKLDPKKRQIAKENGINLVELWSIDDAKTFIDNYGVN